MTTQEKYDKFLIADYHPEIEEMISKRWIYPHQFDKAKEEIEKLDSPSREVYFFIYYILQGNWEEALPFLEELESNYDQFDKYHKISLERMRSIVHFAKWEVKEVIEILKNAYDNVHYQYSWLRRTIAVDIRNIAMSTAMKDSQQPMYEKGSKWQDTLLKLVDYNPVNDRNDGYTLDKILEETFEAGITQETTQRFSSKLENALQSQYANLCSSVRMGYFTGFSIAKRQIGLILFHFANLYNDDALLNCSLYELIENGNKSEVEKILKKLFGRVIKNRANAEYLFYGINDLPTFPIYTETRLLLMRFIYDYLDDKDCENIDNEVRATLLQETKNGYILECKRLALKIFPLQSTRIAPNWLLKFANMKIVERKEHGWFFHDIFEILNSINAKECDASLATNLISSILQDYQNENSFKNMRPFAAIHNLLKGTGIDPSFVDEVLFKKNESRVEAFKSHKLYFTTLNHKNTLDLYEKQIEETISEYENDAKIIERPSTWGIGAYTSGDVINNIILNYYEEIKKPELWERLANATISFCLCPHITKHRKRSALNTIIQLANKLDNSIWKKHIKNIKLKFPDFAKAINAIVLSPSQDVILGALAGNAFLKMGGELSAPLWNYIWGDKTAYIDERIDCIYSMAEIAEHFEEYSTLAFYALAELTDDDDIFVARRTIARISKINLFPQNITPMICQCITTASYSGNEYIREASAYTMKAIIDRIPNDYWKEKLTNRLVELKEDDSRFVRQQALMKSKD